MAGAEIDEEDEAGEAEADEEFIGDGGDIDAGDSGAFVGVDEGDSLVSGHGARGGEAGRERSKADGRGGVGIDAVRLGVGSVGFGDLVGGVGEESGDEDGVAVGEGDGKAVWRSTSDGLINTIFTDGATAGDEVTTWIVEFNSISESIAEFGKIAEGLLYKGEVVGGDGLSIGDGDSVIDDGFFRGNIGVAGISGYVFFVGGITGKVVGNWEGVGPDVRSGSFVPFGIIGNIRDAAG